MTRAEKALADLKALWNMAASEPIPDRWHELLKRLK